MIDHTGNVQEMFRIPPMINEVNQAAGGIGRDVRSAPPATVTVTPTSRNASNTLGSQPLVANGLQFDNRGNLYIADTARGALWRVKVSSNSTPSISTGCDTTYTANTLHGSCPRRASVPRRRGWNRDRQGGQHLGRRERAPGGDLRLREHRKVVEVYRNPTNAAKVRNEGPLETPTSPVLVNSKFCTANSTAIAGQLAQHRGRNRRHPAARQDLLLRPGGQHPGISLPIH
jgi:hypothetical protein